MDIYELISQFAYLDINEKFIEKTKHYISALQENIDKSRLSDSMVLVGVPSRE